MTEEPDLTVFLSDIEAGPLAQLYRPVSMLEKQYFPSIFGDGDLHQGMTGDTKSDDYFIYSVRGDLRDG